MFLSHSVNSAVVEVPTSHATPELRAPTQNLRQGTERGPPPLFNRTMHTRSACDRGPSNPPRLTSRVRRFQCADSAPAPPDHFEPRLRARSDPARGSPPFLRALSFPWCIFFSPSSSQGARTPARRTRSGWFEGRLVVFRACRSRLRESVLRTGGGTGADGVCILALRGQPNTQRWPYVHACSVK